MRKHHFRRLYAVSTALVIGLTVLLTSTVAANAAATSTDSTEFKKEDIVSGISDGIEARKAAEKTNKDPDRTALIQAYQAEYKNVSKYELANTGDEMFDTLIDMYFDGLNTMISSEKFSSNEILEGASFFAGEYMYNTAVYGLCIQYDLSFTKEEIDTLEARLEDQGRLEEMREKPATTGNTVFRNTIWGMSREEVINAEDIGTSFNEGKMNGRTATYIAIKSEYVGKDCVVAYYFDDKDRLFQVRVLIDEDYMAASKYISDYDDIVSQLTKKYGKPKYDEPLWESSMYKEWFADDPGLALASGYVSYYAIYDLPDLDTDIIVETSAETFDVTMSINYSSKSLEIGAADYSDDI